MIGQAGTKLPTPPRQPRTRTTGASALALLGLALGVVLVHSASIWGTDRLTAHHDNLDGAAPLRMAAARQWNSGQIPLWNPYKRAGMPLMADTTAGAIYPGNVPFLFVEQSEAQPAAGDSPVFDALDQVAVLHALLAGGFMFVFLRAIAISAPAAVLGGLLYACSGTMGWFAAWYIQIQNSVAWLPLILAAVHEAGSGGAHVRAWIAAGAAAVALQFFAGFPETSFYSGLLAIGYALSITGGARRWRPLAAVAAIYVAGIALASVQLLPSVELQLLSRRPPALPLEAFQSLPATLSMIPGWIVPSGTPGLEFPPVAAYHFGAAAIVAAAAGLFAFDRRSLFFAVVFVVSLLLCLGAATPVSGWAHQIPGFNAFRHPFKHLFELSFAMAGLAALGADRVVRFRSGTSRWPLVVVIVAVVLSAVSLRINQSALVAGNPASVDVSGRAPEIVRHLEPGWRVLTPRYVFQPRDPAVLLGDYPSQFAVPALHGAGPYLWSTLAEAAGLIEEESAFRRGLFDARDRTLALLSCRYVVQTRRGDKVFPALDPSVYRPVTEIGASRLMERQDALPRIRYVDSVRCSDPHTIVAAQRGETIGPRETALVDCSQQPRPAATFTAASSLRAQIVEDEPGRLVIATEVPADGRGFLVVAQADLPGWHALADGRPAAIRRVHGLVQGIEVAGGTARVELFYRPRSFVIGASVSALTLLLLLIAVLSRKRV